MKTRYTIIEPGPIRFEDLFTMKWTDVELKLTYQKGVQNPQFRDREVYDLRQVLAPLFPDGLERVHVNSFKGAADMFVAERSATGARGRIYKNDGATLIYWTATAMHWIARNIGEPPTYAEMQRTALQYAAEAMDGRGPLIGRLREETPRVYGRAVLFDCEVWS